MFISEYTYSLESKRRLGIPVKFRKLLGKKAVITRGLEHCLFLYPAKEWSKSVAQLSKLSLYQSDARGFSRFMLAGATEVTIDSLGRILIPDYLKKYAKITKKTIVAGINNRVEIWDEKEWKNYKEKIEKDVEAMAERLKGLES